MPDVTIIESQADIDKMVRDVWGQTSHWTIKCNDLSSLDFSKIEGILHNKLSITIDMLSSPSGALDLSWLDKVRQSQSQFGFESLVIKNEALVCGQEIDVDLILPSFIDFPKLHRIEISGVRLPEEITWPPSLEELNFDRISGLAHLTGLPETVEKINIQRSQIKIVTLDNNRCLETLVLQGNSRLSELIVTDGCPITMAVNDSNLTSLHGVKRQIRSLEMSNTPIETLLPGYIDSLQELYASCSAFRHPETLQDCKYLLSIDLSQTVIDEFACLQSLPSLQHLYIRDRAYSEELRSQLEGVNCTVHFANATVPPPLLKGELTVWDLQTAPTDKEAKFVLSRIGWKPVVEEFGQLIGEYNGHQLHKVEVRGWRCYVLQSGDRYREVESDDPQTALLR